MSCCGRRDFSTINDTWTKKSSLTKNDMSKSEGYMGCGSCSGTKLENTWIGSGNVQPHWTGARLTSENYLEQGGDCPDTPYLALKSTWGHQKPYQSG